MSKSPTLPTLPNLPAALARTGHSQADVSRAMRVSRTTVMRWFNGSGGPKTVEKLQELAKYLGVTVAYLVDEEDAVHDQKERGVLRGYRNADPQTRAAIDAVLKASQAQSTP